MLFLIKYKEEEFYFLFTSTTPSIIIIPLAIMSSVILSFNNSHAAKTVTKGSIYKNAPTRLAGISFIASAQIT
jgi:hypothetical protein